jgi:dTDP-3-amino-3,4,6-trideoxy-alpha-D-glucose transaminase
VTDDPGLADRVRLARQYGQAQRYEHVSRGVNSRLDELQAAILRAKLPHLAAANRRRAEIGARYDEALSGLPLNRLERLPETTEVFHLYVVRTPERDRVQAALAERGVQTLIHYPHPVHRHPGYANLNRPGIELAAAERLAGEVLSLPLFPELTDDEVEHVAVSLAEVARGG